MNTQKIDKPKESFSYAQPTTNSFLKNHQDYLDLNSELPEKYLS